MKPYADSNFFTRFYLPGDFQPHALKLAEEVIEAGTKLPVFWLHRVEIRNAFELFVFVSRTSGRSRVTPEAAAAAQARFRDDCVGSGLLAVRTLPLATLESQTLELCSRHSAKHGFRTYDVLHVSAALLFKCDTFLSYDAKCNHLAALEGLATPAAKPDKR
jgi:predicted nucleic acid-binding protein